MHRPTVYIQDIWKLGSIETMEFALTIQSSMLLFLQPECL
jgi:hypothetical protein